MPAMFLLISNYEEDHHWCRLLREALAPLDPLEIQREEASLECLVQNCYDLVIVDASTIGDVPQLVCRVQNDQPGTRIVVVSASPTWRQAREAFRAGAMDYVRKSLSKRKLHTFFADILSKVPPSWLY